eukprot:4398632-Pleurochrysis_carterae.AAC.5
MKITILSLKQQLKQRRGRLRMLRGGTLTAGLCSCSGAATCAGIVCSRGGAAATTTAEIRD